MNAIPRKTMMETPREHDGAQSRRDRPNIPDQLRGRFTISVNRAYASFHVAVF
jgi:hypothetical protein